MTFIDNPCGQLDHERENHNLRRLATVWNISTGHSWKTWINTCLFTMEHPYITKSAETSLHNDQAVEEEKRKWENKPAAVSWRIGFHVTCDGMHESIYRNKCIEMLKCVLMQHALPHAVCMSSHLTNYLLTTPLEHWSLGSLVSQTSATRPGKSSIFWRWCPPELCLQSATRIAGNLPSGRSWLLSIQNLGGDHTAVLTIPCRHWSHHKAESDARISPMFPKFFLFLFGEV